MYYENLASFIKSKGLKQKEFAEISGLNPNMVSKYLNGSSDISGEIVMKISKAFPDLDLNKIFAEVSENGDLVEEPSESYNFNVIDELVIVQKKLDKIREELARKSHG